MYGLTRINLILIPLFLVCLRLAAAQAEEPSLAARRQALKALINEHWEYTMRTAPEYASMLGDKRYNDQLSDVSAGAVRRDQDATRRFLARFRAIDTAGFPEQEQLNRRLMVRQLELSIAGVPFKDWEMPIDQMNGFHLGAAQWPTFLPFQTVNDYRDYIVRLHKLPRYFDQEIALTKQGERDGLMPPKFLLEKVPAQIDAILAATGADSPFAAPLKKFPAAIGAVDQEAIRKETLAAIQNSVVPAYRRLREFVRDEYAPKGRAEPGVWALPDGAARYAYDLRTFTTTNLTPEALHQLGLQQVAEYEAEEMALATRLGFQDLSSLRAAVKADPKRHAQSGEEILALYRKYIDQMYLKLPELFTRLPKARMEVVPVEAFRAKEAAPAAYTAGAPDGSRPGRVEVNTYDWQERLTTDFESTAYHEGVPGHHLQITIAQELTDLPMFRREAFYSAYQEGWALYAERLGKDIGFYQDPYSNYGRIENELWRAVRLVVDTGLHAKRWSRQQVVDYFHAHTGVAEVDVQSETDRYIVLPGQALAYKAGQLTILRLRERAKAALGDRFDLRRFHDEVLGAGALPLDVLEERIDAWTAAQKTAQSVGSGQPSAIR